MASPPAARSPKPRQALNCRSRATANYFVKTIAWALRSGQPPGQKKPLFTLHPAKISGRAVAGKHLLTIAT